MIVKELNQGNSEASKESLAVEENFELKPLQNKYSGAL